MFEKTHCVQDACAEINTVRVIGYVFHCGLYVIYILTYASSRRRSRDLDNSNKFGQTK